MVMDEHEILFSYKNAADQKEQVKILAELNDVDVWTMVTFLKEHGAEISYQKFQKYNPKWKAAIDKSTTDAPKDDKEPDKTQQAAQSDGPTKEQYEEALRGIVALREELNRVKAENRQERRRTRSEGENELSTVERKLNRIKSILTAFYAATAYDHATALMIIDLIAREGDTYDNN